MRSVTPKRGTPTAKLYGCNGSGEQAEIDGVTVWLKGESPTYDWNDRANSPYKERAAYLVDRMLNLKLVPPTVLLLFDGKVVSAQRWVNGNRPSYAEPAIIVVFDYIIANSDRHDENWLIENGKVWAIDNAYSFILTDYFNTATELRRLRYSINDLSAEDKAKLVARLELVLAKPRRNIHRRFDYLIGKKRTEGLINRMATVLDILKEDSANV